MEQNTKKLSDFDSVWEWTKSRSSYHFDKFTPDRPNSTFQVVRNFPVTWASELDIIKQRSFPKTWNNITATGGSHGHKVLAIDKRASDIAKGGGDIDKIELTDVVDDFREFPELAKVIESFKLDKAQARCHVQKTGQMFTRHIDPIQRMFYGIGKAAGEHNPDPDMTDYGYDVNDIVRVTVMLEDWEPGQFMIYGNTVYQQWRAGECHYFDWPNVPHATANASEHTRITLQVTGLRTAETDPRLDVRNFRRT
jgi:hypothetical protein